MGRTLSEKVWDRHVVYQADGEPDLLFIDLHLIHEVDPTSPSPPKITTSQPTTSPGPSPIPSPGNKWKHCGPTAMSSASPFTQWEAPAKASCT